MAAPYPYSRGGRYLGAVLRRACIAALTVLTLVGASARGADGPNVLVNGDFETGDLTGWTIVEGKPVASAKPKAKDWPGPFQGKWYFYGHRSSRGIVEQAVAVGENARGGVAILRGMFRGNGGDDRAIATLSALDATSARIAHATTAAISRRAWKPETLVLELPAGTRTVVVRLIAERQEGNAADGCADAVSLVLHPRLDALLDPETGEPLSASSLAALGRLAETSADERLTLGAGRALSARGENGWTKLAAAVRRRVKDGDASVAIELVSLLAAGAEDGRRKRLRLLVGQSKTVSVQRAILVKLAGFYPLEMGWLDSRLRDLDVVTPATLEALAANGLPTAQFERFLVDPRLAETASEILRRRNAPASAEASSTLARKLAVAANSTGEWRATLDRWTPQPDWGAVSALVPLLADDDARARTGAHMLLMGVSGLNFGPDAEIWTSWIEANRDGYTPPSVASSGHVEVATMRGVRWLLARLDKQGHVARSNRTYKPGSTALAVFALLHAGVPRDHPVIQRIASEMILPPSKTVRTYTLGVQAMVLRELDPVAHRQRLQEIANKIVAGQHAEGGWSYECYGPTSSKKLRRRDMSCTQYAILGLRACRRAGAEIPRETWERAMKRVRARRWNTNARELPGWAYRRGQRPSFSMTGAGVGSLAICLEALHGAGAADVIAKDGDLQRGLGHLGQYVLNYRGMGNITIYAYHALERACALTATRSFSGIDWFEAGAADLMAAQEDDGQWSDASVSPRRRLGGYSTAIETAYALLFPRQATTPVDAERSRGDLYVKGFGPREHTAGAGFVPKHSFVANWHIARRIIPWIDRSTFVDLSPESRRALADAALRAPLRRSTKEYIQFVHHVGGRCRDVAGYAARRVVCDEPTRVKLLYGSNDSIRAWVGDTLFLEELVIRGSKADQGEAWAEFPAGESTLLIELSQYLTWWSMYIRFETEDGKKLQRTDAGRLVPFVPPSK